MQTSAGPDFGSLQGLDPDTCFLLTATALGQTIVALEQHVLSAALDVYLRDPFPDQAAGWGALLEGTAAEFFGPRDIYSMSYFLTVENKRWGARVAACRERAQAARAFRAARADGAKPITVQLASS